MAKTKTEMDDDGRIHTYKNTRSRRASESQLIPWTPGPKNRWQKFVRSAIG
jgi:hypothetical protein